MPGGAIGDVLVTLSATPIRATALAQAALVTSSHLHVALYRLSAAGYATRSGTRRAATWTRTPAGDAIAPLVQAGLSANTAFILNLADTQAQTLSAITALSIHNGGSRWHSEIHNHLTTLALADLLVIRDRMYALTPSGQHLQTTTRALFGTPATPPAPEPAQPRTAAPTSAERSRRVPLKRRILQCLDAGPMQAAELHARIPEHGLDSIRCTLSAMQRDGLVTRSPRAGSRPVTWSAA